MCRSWTGCLNDDIKVPVNKIQDGGGADNEKYKLPKKTGYNEIQNIGEMIGLEVRERVPLMC